MPDEITPKDLKRLQALEGRLTKATDERKALAAEKRELRAAVTANARRAAAAEKETAAATGRAEAMAEENRALAVQLQEARADLQRVQEAALRLRAATDAAEEDGAKLRAELAEATKLAKAATRDRDASAAALKIAREQLEGQGTAPVLPARDVAGLIDGLVNELGHAMPGLGVREGELKLQVAFATVGGTGGFVVPSADSPAELRDSVHDLTLRFDRSAIEP